MEQAPELDRSSEWFIFAEKQNSSEHFALIALMISNSKNLLEPPKWRHDTQLNDIQHNDTHQNDVQ